VTLNTDNRLITDTTVTKELSVAHREMGFTLDDLCTLLVQGFKSAFLPFREKQDLLKAANAEIADVLARFSGPRPLQSPAPGTSSAAG
jgi:adenosine deaminase